jgi:hypothetical protein
MKQIHSSFELLAFVVYFKLVIIFFVLWRLVELNIASGVCKDDAVFIFIYPSSLLHWIEGRQVLAYAGKSATILYRTMIKKTPVLISE